MIALADFLYLGSIEDIKSISIFVCIGILTVFFSKNMIVILSSALIVTNIIKYGVINEITEGFTDDKEDKDDDDDKEDKDDKDDDKKLDEETDSTEKKTVKIKRKVVGGSIKTSDDVVEMDSGTQFSSIKDHQLGDQEKMILAHEKLLERMNKYKPLLDTLQGITKNIAVVKSMTVSKQTTA